MSATRPASRRSNLRSSSSTSARVRASTPTSSLPSSSGRNIRTPPRCGCSTTVAPRKARPARVSSICSGSPRDEPSARQRPEHPLALVLQEDRDVPTPDPGRLLRHQRCDQVRRHLVSPVEQDAQQPLAEPLRAVDRHPPALPLALAHRGPPYSLAAGPAHENGFGWPAVRPCSPSCAISAPHLS